MPLNQVLSDYRSGINQVNSLISFAYQQNANQDYVHSNSIQEFITTSAFLRMFIHWEAFLENAFVEYMVGELSITGRPVQCYVSPADREHVHRILIGTQRYVDWANHDIVIKLADLFFLGGEPLKSNLSAVRMDLIDLRTIRNAAAHLSSTTQPKLDALASRKLSRPVSRVSVSDLIMALDPNSPSGTTSTFLQSYQLLLDITAENICSA